MAPNPVAQTFYDFVTEDEEGRTCEAIPASACAQTPNSFTLNVLNGSATKLAEQLASPSLVLPWLIAALGAPAALAGWLVPVKQAGSLLPQIAVAGRIRTFERRKWFWVGAGITQALALALMLAAVALLPPVAAGVSVVGLLGLFSVASGVGSVAFKDVLAKTIPEGRRGTLLAMRATIGGGLTLIAGLLIRLYVGEDGALTPYLVLLGVAALLWALGALSFAAIQEVPGATGGGRNTLEEARAGLHLLRGVAGFRRFVLARALLLSIVLSVPFYALYARDVLGVSLGGLGVFVIANGLANILSSPFWGRFSDTSSRLVMVYSALLAAGGGGLALLVGALPDAWQNAYVYAPVLIVVGVAYSGARLGRKTYLVDGAPQDERPLYVALSNTLIGVVTLIGGGLGFIAQAFGLAVLIGVFIGLALVAAWLCWRLPEASDMTKV